MMKGDSTRHFVFATAAVAKALVLLRIYDSTSTLLKTFLEGTLLML